MQNLANKDPYILLSVTNTKLRDYYPNVEEFCKSEDINEHELHNRLLEIGYKYDEKNNQFISK